MKNLELDTPKLIELLILDELKKANNKFPQFQSRHEAWAVILEELEESQDEIDLLTKGILKDYWKLCRKDKNKDLYNSAMFILEALQKKLKESIRELIQVGAMIKKSMQFELMEEQKREDKRNDKQTK